MTEEAENVRENVRTSTGNGNAHTSIGNENVRTSIDHVQMKAPTFMDDAVDAWFSILEAQFEICRVTTSSTKFFNTLSHLPPNVVKRLSKTILNSKNYDALKEAVITIYEQSKPELLDKLLESSRISGRPSLYLQEMISVAERLEVGDDIIRHRFINSLPDSARPFVASQQSLSLQQLGKLADDFIPYLGNASRSNVMAVSTPRCGTSYQRNARPQNRNDSNLPTHVRPFSKDQRTKVCRFHLYFADSAKYCRPWCRWPNKNKCNIQSSSRPTSRSSSPSSQRDSQEN